MTNMIPMNASARQSLVVEKAHTADQIGSGSLEVLATPMLIALMEAAAVEAVDRYLSTGFTTVGSRIEMEHLRPTPVGGTVTAEAVLVKREDRALDFSIEARDARGVVGQASHRRFIVVEQEFLSRTRS